MDIALFILLTLCTLAGVVLAAFQLPGLWLILACGAGYDGYFGWTRIGWMWWVGIVAAAIAVETFDTLAGMFAARKAGASRRAAIGALIGGFVGMIVLSVPIPIPGVGAIIGGLLGCFFGALLAEMSLNRQLTTGMKVGAFAAIGKLIGLTLKTSTAAIIAGTLISLAAWSTFGSASVLR